MNADERGLIDSEAALARYPPPAGMKRRLFNLAMRKKLLATAGGLAVAVALVIGLASVADYLITSPADRRFRSAFREVEAGMPEQQVLQILGDPDERSRAFFLGQREGFESAYQRASASHSAYYLVWRREPDVVYSVGIDSNGRATIAEVGGT
jgi:hypothetical protein